MPNSGLRSVPTPPLPIPPNLWRKGMYSCLFPIAVYFILYGSLGLSLLPSPTLFSRCSVMEQVEETLQSIADSAICVDDDHVHVVDHILGPLRRRHLSGHGGTGRHRDWRPQSGSCYSPWVKLADDVQCHSSCQRQCQALLDSIIAT